MKTTKLISSLNQVAIFLAIVGMVGATYVVSAQKRASGPGPIQSLIAPVVVDNLRMDFNGDQLADFVFASPSSNVWMIQSLDGRATYVNIGEVGDRPVPADYDGDKIEDVAVVHPKGGAFIWQIQRSSDGKVDEYQWGVDGDVPVQGDYDGDGLADVAVWHPVNSTWSILLSRTGSTIEQQWGQSSDKAMPGDYDGDGLTDVCVFRPGSNTFMYFASRDNTMVVSTFGPFLFNGYESFVLADYDGDGKTDFATYDPTSGVWVILESSTSTYRTLSLIGSTPVCETNAIVPCTILDFAVPADYDHDGMVDPAIWDSVNATVVIMGSTSGATRVSTKTSEDMIPVSSFFMTK